ncbi:uncharacterized protein LOC144340457 [Macaca mulatta]
MGLCPGLQSPGGEKRIWAVGPLGGGEEASAKLLCHCPLCCSHPDGAACTFGGQGLIPGWGKGTLLSRCSFSPALPGFALLGDAGMEFEEEILRCSCLAAENHHPPGVLRPHPWRAQAGYAHATPPVSLPVWPMEELRMARPARAWQSPVVLCMEAWEDFVGRGGGERVLEAVGRWLPHPFQPSSLPGFGGPQLSQLAWRCGGLPLPCGSLRHSSAW